jgi:hypothetical protein
VVFADNFDSAPSSLWGNERGVWVSADGRYGATQPTNSPTTLSSLPFSLGDFDLDVDIRQVSDGGVYMHIDAQAQNGVLLVTGGNSHTGSGFYWHTITGGGFSGSLNQTPPLFSQFDDIHIRVAARGPTYSVFLNGSPQPVTTLTLSQARNGLVGVYDFTASPGQDFDNVVLSRVCYANCDDSTTSPVLNVGDFTCFLQKYAAGDAYANCDGSTTAPVLNVGDFTCFLQQYAAGCP